MKYQRMKPCAEFKERKTRLTCNGCKPLGLVSLTEAEPSAISCCTAARLPLLQNLNIGASSCTARMGSKLNCHPAAVLPIFASIPCTTPSLESHQDGKNEKEETTSNFLPELESTRTD